MLCNRDKVEIVRRISKYEGMFTLDVKGKSGGLALLWQNLDNVSIPSYSRNHIDVETKVYGVGTWRLTRIYGEPNCNERLSTWCLLRLLKTRYMLP